MTPDRELLRSYTETRSEEAFAELVRRHLDFVYSAALRQVNGDAYLAQDVAQTVFTDLARKSHSLARRDVLTGWLYTSAHFAAAKIVRTENRRRDREEKFMREPIHQTAPEPDWEKLRPVLDNVMHELKETDREAILLRYFENRPLAEVGAKLGLSENAARMRVERAVEKLRGFLARRGITASAVLASVISANAVQIAPAGLAATLTSASLGVAGTGTTLTLMKIMTMTKLKLAISAIVVAGAAATVVVQHQTQTKLRDENRSLRDQIAQLNTDAETLSNRFAANNSQLRPDDQLIELLKLRGEVRLLRDQTNALGKLSQENRQMRSAIATAQKQTPEDAEFNRQRTESVNALKQLALAIRVNALDNNDRYATNFTDLSSELGDFTNHLASVGLSLDGFEFVTPGLVNDHTPDKIMFQEKLPRKTPDGKWQKAYALADGTVQTINSDDGNFDAWEKEHTIPPPPNQ